MVASKREGDIFSTSFVGEIFDIRMPSKKKWL